MTEKEAFVSGVRLFCKRAGYDADDAAHMERLLLMPEASARPIIKEARLTVGQVNYVRTGMMLKGAGQVQDVIAELQGRNFKEPAELRQISDWAQKQEQAAALRQAQQRDDDEGMTTEYWGGGRAYSSAAERDKAMNSKTTGTATPAAKTDAGGDIPGEAESQRMKSEYEKSPMKGRVPYEAYVSLKQQYDQAKAYGGEVVPEDVFIGGQWAATKNQIETRTSRRIMRGYDLDMAPGQLAGLTDQDIAARSKNPDVQRSMRYARDLAAERQTLQGGVAARMGTGLTTGNNGGSAPAQVAATTPPPSQAPMSTAPAPSNLPGGAGSGGLMGEMQHYAQTGEDRTMFNGASRSNSGTPPATKSAVPTDSGVINKFSPQDIAGARSSGGSVSVGLPSGGKFNVGTDSEKT